MSTLLRVLTFNDSKSSPNFSRRTHPPHAHGKVGERERKMKIMGKSQRDKISLSSMKQAPKLRILTFTSICNTHKRKQKRLNLTKIPSQLLK